MSEGSMPGIFWEIRLTRVLSSTEFEMARKIAPLSVNPHSKTNGNKLREEKTALGEGVLR